VGAGAEERNKIAMLFLYFIVIVIKIIPIYFLRNAPFKIVNNTIIFLLVILVYYYYLATNGINMYDFYRNINEKAFDGITPFVHQMFQLIK
jgi:hypothetical protein